VFWGKVKGKKGMFLKEKGFCKEGFVLKIVPNMERRGKEKSSGFRMLHGGSE
jgi:hypothetical protein